MVRCSVNHPNNEGSRCFHNNYQTSIVWVFCPHHHHHYDCKTSPKRCIRRVGIYYFRFLPVYCIGILLYILIFSTMFDYLYHDFVLHMTSLSKRFVFAQDKTGTIPYYTLILDINTLFETVCHLFSVVFSRNWKYIFEQFRHLLNSLCKHIKHVLLSRINMCVPIYI